MYVPRHFAEDDPETLSSFIDQRGVGTLVSHGVNGLTVGEVPLLLQPGTDRLWGHLARPNPQLQDLASGEEVLVNFLGPTGYVSPNWYSDPGMVPTWNFVSVQVRGTPTVHDDAEVVLDIVKRLSAKHEADFDTPWTIEKMDPDMLEKMLGVIVGFSIDIIEIRGKYKLSQNRSAADRRSVVEGLSSLGNVELAAVMQAQEEKDGAE